jgi:hypothetical protein
MTGKGRHGFQELRHLDPLCLLHQLELLLQVWGREGAGSGSGSASLLMRAKSTSVSKRTSEAKPSHLCSTNDLDPKTNPSTISDNKHLIVLIGNIRD